MHNYKITLFAAMTVETIFKNMQFDSFLALFYPQYPTKENSNFLNVFLPVNWDILQQIRFLRCRKHASESAAALTEACRNPSCFCTSFVFVTWWLENRHGEAQTTRDKIFMLAWTDYNILLTSIQRQDEIVLQLAMNQTAASSSKAWFLLSMCSAWQLSCSHS